MNRSRQIKICCIILFFLLSISIFAEIQFVDVTTAAGITFRHVDGRTGEKYLLETLGSGAVFFDFDVDGALDLYVVNATHIPPPTRAKKHLQTHPPSRNINSIKTTATVLLLILQTVQALEIPVMASDVQPPISITTAIPKFT